MNFTPDYPVNASGLGESARIGRLFEVRGPPDFAI
jgi:hypothetical protein